MPFVSIRDSPLLPGQSPVRIYYRDLGQGPPLVILHGGWGYEFYPYTDAIERLPNRFVIPDRTGYGRSSHIEASLRRSTRPRRSRPKPCRTPSG